MLLHGKCLERHASRRDRDNWGCNGTRRVSLLHQALLASLSHWQLFASCGSDGTSKHQEAT